MSEQVGAHEAAPRAAPKGEWHYAPELPIGNNPLFEFPWRIDRILSYYREYWLSLSETVVFLLVAIAGWALLEAPLGDMSVLSAGWAGIVYALNFGLVVAFAGGLHLFFYTLRKQGDETKYVPQFGHRGGGRSPLATRSGTTCSGRWPAV